MAIDQKNSPISVFFSKRTLALSVSAKNLWKISKVPPTQASLLRHFFILTLLTLGLCRCAHQEAPSIAYTSYNANEGKVPTSLTYASPNATTRPYFIKGIQYFPQEHIEMESVALASHYGKGDGFHGRRTATGERFSMYGLTGAHKTAYLPCLAYITNLENGKRAIIKLNDRGPFIPGRDLDVSWQAAKVLGFDQKGLAKVHIKVLVTETLALASLTPSPRSRQQAPPLMLAARIAPLKHTNTLLPYKKPPPCGPLLASAPEKAKHTLLASTIQSPQKKVFITLGTYRTLQTALRFHKHYSALLPGRPLMLRPKRGGLVRIMVGPFTHRMHAKNFMEVLHAKGFKQAGMELL